MKKKMIPKSAVQSLIKAIDRYIAKADQNFRDEIESEGFLAADAAMEAEEALENGMTDAINNHVDGVLDTLSNASSLKYYVEKTWPEVQKETELRGKLYDLFYTQFTQLLHTGVVTYLKASDKDVGAAAEEDGRVTPYATEFINGWSGQLADIMHLSTDRQINKILVDSAEKHLSISDTTLAIGNSAIRSPGARSRLVAQTEVLRVESYSQLEAMRQDPAASEKEWIHTGAEKNKPRENHVAISGQTVPIEEPFSLSGYKPMCPRDTSLPPEESINCHCIMRQKKDSKVLGLSADERKALREKYLKKTEEEWREREELELFGEDGKIKITNAEMPKSLSKYTPNRERRKAIIARGIAEEKPIFDDGDLGEAAKYLPPKKGYYDVVMHGDEKSLFFFGERIDPETLCAILINRDDYEQGTPIRFICCRSGASDDGPAKYISDKLGTEVMAPNKLAVLIKRKKGDSYISTLHSGKKKWEKGQAGWEYFGKKEGGESDGSF